MPRGVYRRHPEHYLKMTATRRVKYPNNEIQKKSALTRKLRGSDRGGLNTDQAKRAAETRKRNGTPWIRHSDETKQQISEKLVGKKKSDDVRRNMRIGHIKYAQKTGAIWHTIGRHETELLDKQELIDNCKIFRQHPISLLGYVVDGYCSETNTVYEVYEQAHRKNIQKDLQRETEIRNLLSCDFRILWDTKG